MFLQPRASQRIWESIIDSLRITVLQQDHSETFVYNERVHKTAQPTRSQEGRKKGGEEGRKGRKEGGREGGKEGGKGRKEEEVVVQELLCTYCGP